jgi:Cyclic phosphodiesterase-like protein
MVPTGHALTAYDGIVGTMAMELGTFHFLPHITLVAALMEPVEDILQKTRQLATMVAPYEFHLQDVAQKDAYFQCVYATMKLTDQVLNANTAARTVFEEKQNDPPYMPHLSLIYGDFTAHEKNERLIPKLRQQLLDGAPETETIPVDAIEIWSTQGDVKEWYLVERVPLTAPTNNTVPH